MDRIPLRRALLRPRHVLATAFVALLTGAIGVGVAAAAGPEQAPPPSAWDEPFSVPHPHVGDRGRYVHAGGHEQRDDGYWPEEVTFEWLPDGEGFNETGARLLANQLLLKWINEEPDLLLLEPGSNQRLGGMRHDNSSDTQPGSLLFPAETRDEASKWSFFGGHGAATMWCGIKTPLQGLTVDLTRRLKDPTDCWNGPHSWAPDDYSVVVHAVGGVAPQRFAVVDSYMTEDLERAHGGRPFMRSTHLEGFPYATRLEFMSGDTGPDPDGYSAAYELAGFALGAVPIAVEPKVLSPSPPPLVLAARTMTGPDTTGFEHPYPLSVAWEQASSDPSFTELQDYLAAHPEAYVGQASVQETTSNGQRSHHWYVVLTDGEEQYAYRHIHTPGPVESPVGSPVPAPILQSAGGDSYDRLTNGWEDGTYPTPDQLPAKVPTVASLVAAWSTVSGRQDANAYGFDLRCGMQGNGTCRTSGAFLAGVDNDDTTGAYLLGSQRRIFSSTLQAAGDGRLVAYSERTSDYDASRLPGAPSTSPDDPKADQPAKLSTLPEPTWIPTPREAAAIGGIALLSTLAYWLWPIAKGAGVGLFSRVHKDRLLDNPLRAQLVQRIEAEPGVHHNALVRDLGRGKGSAEHHLEKLVQARLVLRSRGTGYTCYFPVGTDRRAMAASPALKADGARRIMEALATGPRGVRELAAATGLAPSTVSHHLERLRAAGVVAGSGATGYHAVSASVAPPAAA